MLSQKNDIIYNKKKDDLCFGYYVKSFAVGDGALDVPANLYKDRL